MSKIIVWRIGKDRRYGNGRGGKDPDRKAMAQELKERLKNRDVAKDLHIIWNSDVALDVMEISVGPGPANGTGPGVVHVITTGDKQERVGD